MGLTEIVSASSGYEAETGSLTDISRTRFQWTATTFALFLLILNRMARRSLSLQTTLLVFYIFASLPNELFNLVRGTFGSWLSFIAVGSNLYFPADVPVARFVLFVVVPNSITKGLRTTSAGVIFCLVINVLLALLKFRFICDNRYDEHIGHSICYYVCIALLMFFTITELRLE